MTRNKKQKALPADNPIRRSEHDLLGRADSAKAFARQVLKLDTTEGSTIGVFGHWGSGKTSFINLAREGFENEKIPVIDFNPWFFSGAGGTDRLLTMGLDTGCFARPELINTRGRIGRKVDEPTPRPGASLNEAARARLKQIRLTC